MKRLYSSVSFEGKRIVWDYRLRSDAPFQGYYHWHPCFELLFVHEGEGTVIVNQIAYEIKRGMLFVFQPFHLHKVYPRPSPEQPYIRSKLHFVPEEMADGMKDFPRRFNLLQRLWEGQDTLCAWDLLEHAEYLEQLLRRYDRQGAAKGHASEEDDVLFLLQLLGVMQEAEGSFGHDAAAGIVRRPLRYSEKIMRWIEGHFAEEIGLERIADELHLSKSYVSRVFRTETGASLTDYLTARRIKHACRLLQTTTLPVERIGAEVGLPDASYFVQLFKKVIGTTPLKYRNRA
ncbi:helix-turn-helix domain-containing protein [Cohnella cellulosilytica]|uniref:Helix-turn-helix domain-containing protein n=1 Tax=Cohnella cellulosilytica TaxID=986710 RepID=A0ABW2FMV5_9BACL